MASCVTCLVVGAVVATAIVGAWVEVGVVSTAVGMVTVARAWATVAVAIGSPLGLVTRRTNMMPAATTIISKATIPAKTAHWAVSLPGDAPEMTRLPSERTAAMRLWPMGFSRQQPLFELMLPCIMFLRYSRPALASLVLAFPPPEQQPTKPPAATLALQGTGVKPPSHRSVTGLVADAQPQAQHFANALCAGCAILQAAHQFCI